MKKQIIISTRLIIGVLWLFISFILILVNSVLLYQFAHARDFSQLTPDDLETAKYVDCTINQYVVQTYENGQTSGQSEVYLTPLNNYYVYTIPFHKEYICVRLYDKNTVENMENFSEGEEISFTGKVSRKFQPNYEWHKNVEGFDTSRLIDEYCIIQVNDESMFNLLMIGFIGFFISLYMVCDELKVWRSLWKIK